ncbi:hypothetical protein BC628DRAFT_1404359 [Trametes gibbosa]|nr:hypothetical protein BC628DRAFT_1404359 [Trametes gibbosa]
MSLGGDAVSVTRKALEDEIAMHTQAIIDFKGHLNTMMAIAQLPPKILSEIFLHITKDFYDQHHNCHHPYYSTSCFYAWVQVAHVCHSWYSVALNTPQLWGYIILVQKVVVKRILALSKKAPLLVCASIMTTPDNRVQVRNGSCKSPPDFKNFTFQAPHVSYKICVSRSPVLLTSLRCCLSQTTVPLQCW